VDLPRQLVDNPTMLELFILGLSLVSGAPETSGDLKPLLDAFRAVGREGAGNIAAAAAFKKVSVLKPEILPEILGGLDGSHPEAANWFRGAVDAIAERALARGEPLPAKAIEAFLLDRRRPVAARELAWEWLCRVDSSAPGRLLAGLIDDPSGELRREAVAVDLAAAEKLLASDTGKDAGRSDLRRLFGFSRDPAQVEAIAKRLTELGETADVARHMGFVKEWKLLGPFDGLATEDWQRSLPAGLPAHHAGFHFAYAPETSLDLDVEHAGKAGPVRWKPFTSVHLQGAVDLNVALGKHKGAVAFALAEIDSPGAVPIELRSGTPNAVKIWLNGERIFQREEYHHGMSLDQHIAAGTLKKGRNRILLKVCQNDQTEDWAQDWTFQLRVCDATGKGAP